MDKYEYKVRADEIKELIAQGDYVQAAEIADTIDWRRVKSVMMLCTISDLYKINRRYEDAKNMLLLAYERRPGGRTICYALCELCIKTEEFVQAVNYYKEFVQVAPKDPARYILQYRLYEAQDVSLEERIGVLEELKKRDYREKWAYELAYLYHRVGLATKCVEECDELILWFGEGKYVIKAMELKMLHQPLDPAQQQKYDRRFETSSRESGVEGPKKEEAALSEEDYDDGRNEGIAEIKLPEQENRAMQGDTVVYETVHHTAPEQPPAAEGEKTGTADQTEEFDIHVKTMDMGQYNTINLQAELAAGLREVLGDEQSKSAAITRSIVAPMLDTESLDYPELEEEDVDENDLEDDIGEIEETEVFFGETGDLASVQQETNVTDPDHSAEKPEAKVLMPRETDHDETRQIVMEQIRLEKTGRAEEQAMTAQPPRELAGVLSQESDGQIRLVVPEHETVVEKQITGQMNIQDVLAEWERLKQQSQERREEEVRQRVLQQTGNMFTEFEASVRDGLLEQLESGAAVEPEEELFDSEDDSEEVFDPDDLGEVEELEEIQEEEPEDTPEGEEPVPEPEETAPEAEDPGQSEEPAPEPEETAPEAEEPGQAEEPAPEPEESGQAEEIAPEAEEPGQSEEPAPKAEGPGQAEEIAPEAEGPGQSEEPAPEAEGPGQAEELAQEAEDPGRSEELAPEAEELGQPEESAPEGEESESEEPGQPEKPKPEPEEPAQEAEEPGQPEAESEPEEKPDSSEEMPIEREKPKVRALTLEERELFAPYIQSRAAKEQLVKAIDNISLAAYTGNIIITGDEGMDTTTLAKNIIREVQLTDSNFSGKVAKISGQALNKKDVGETLGKLKNGALIIQQVSGLNHDTTAALYRELQKESLGIIIVLEDSRKAVQKLLEENEDLASCFTARMNVEALSNDMLVAFGRQYAKEQEYAIDDLGVLALHTRIEELQTIDHAVTVMEVKRMVDEAIHHANRKTLGHFVDILIAKRYDEDDRIILTEKDFV